MIEHQFQRYVKSLGRDPDSLTEAEKKELMTGMVKDLYPGNSGTPKLKGTYNKGDTSG